MKILVTGAKGFVGKNLVAQLCNIKSGKAKNYPLSDDITIYEYDVDTAQNFLKFMQKIAILCAILQGLTARKTNRNL